MSKETVTLLLSLLYILAGFVSLSVAVYTIKDDNPPSRIATALFWTILAVIFMFGDYIPPVIVGILLVGMGILTAFKQVKVGNLKNSDDAFRQASSEK